MKVDIYIPDELSDITLEQYQKFAKLNTEENQNTNFLLHKMVEIFCRLDLKDIARIKFNYVTQIVNDLNNIFNTKTELIPTFKMKGVEYGMIPKLDDITLGEYIDLDNNISDWETMHKAMAVLYRPIDLKKDHRYQIKEYTGEEDASVFKDMPLDVVMGCLVFFWSLSEELLQITLKYLAKEMRDNLTSQQRQILEESGVGINQSMDWLRGMLPNLTRLQN
tara:strand:+ start:1880 stop:2542 length:663 start_codon:yes stop_codon:yes gene_type:complete